MKIAKKVLSVLLAIAMVLGTFAVAASANGNPDTATYKVWMKLTAAPISSGVKWTSNARYVDGVWNTPYDDEPGTDEVEGTMEVEPGQIVMINFYVKSNYLTGYCCGDFYFSSGLLDPGEIYMKQRNQTSVNTTKTDKMIQYNENSEYIGYFIGASSSTRTVPSVTIPDLSRQAFNVAKNDDGTYYFTGDHEMTADEYSNCGYKFFRWGTYPAPAGNETCIIGEDDVSILYFPVMVPDDAAPGAEYKFFMPEAGIKRDKNTAGNTYVTYVPGGQTKTELNKPANKYFNDDQYFDLSGMNLTLKVKGGSTEVDYSKLQAKYDEVKDTVVANYNNTEDFVAALADAKKILDAKTADQATVNAAYDALVAGYAKLAIKDADYTALDKAKAAAAAINADNYEQDANWTAFQIAYNAAKNVAADLDITHQAEIDKAATDLTTAIGKLTPKAQGADYTALDAAIKAAQKIIDEKSASWYTADSWSAMTTALAAANAVSRNLTIADQAIIDNAASALNTAVAGLKEADASYTALDALVTECDALNQADYTSASWTPFASALTAAKGVARNLKAKDQATIDTAYNNLKAAKDGLKTLGAADYSALIAEINKGTTYTKDYYTTDSWSAYETVLTNAQAMVDAGNLKEDQQSQITKMVEDLVAAKAALELVGADYTAVDAALAKIPTDADLAAYYTTETAEAVIAAKNAVVRGKTKDKQGEVDKMASAIEDAVSKLALIPADTADLKTAMDKARAIDQGRYTSDSYKAMMAKYEDAKALYETAGLTKKDNQAAVDAMTTALNDAIKALVPAGADYSKVQAALERFEALTESHYTAVSWAAAKTKYDAAKEAYGKRFTVDQQAELDAYATELNAAIDALVEAAASFTDLDTAIQKLNSNLTTYAKFYTEAYKTSANDLIASAKTTEFRALKAKDQATVDAKTAEITALTNAPEYLAWDYTKINEAKAEYEAIDRDLYTDDSLAAVDALFAGIKWDYIQDPVKHEGEATSQYIAARNQEKSVLAWASLLVQKPTVEKADYTELDAAIAEAEALIAKGTGNYTDDSVKVLKDALAEGKALSRDLTVDDQATVDAAAAKIKGAMPLTEKDADYTALDAAIALAKTKNADDYTEASYSAMTAKLAAAEAVARDLKISSQATITKAANELNAAISALVLKPTEVKGAIVSVDWTPTSSDYNTYAVKVNRVDDDYAAKIQFIDAYGNTRTITRHSNAVSIVSYRADGSIVEDERDASAAYEVWTVLAKLTTGSETKVIAKFANWESKDVAYKFTVNRLAPTADTTVYSITPAATSGERSRVGVQVVTGMDIQGVRTVMYNGGTLTTKAYTVVNGQKVYNAQASCFLTGDNAIKVQVKYNNEWHDAGSFTYVAK